MTLGCLKSPAGSGLGFGFMEFKQVKVVFLTSLRVRQSIPRFHNNDPIELIFATQGNYNPFITKIRSILSYDDDLTPRGQVGPNKSNSVIYTRFG